MRNQTTFILLAICFLAIVYVLIYGVKIGGFEVLSVKQIIEKNNILNDKILTSSSLISNEYDEAQKTLEQTFEQQKIAKQKYEEKMSLVSESKEKIHETKQYDIDYLWRVIGAYATKQNLKLVMSVQKTTGQNLYDFNFTVTGTYANTIKFITNIENNSDLNFRIYNFKMVGETEIVTSTFTIKNINIDPETTIRSSYVPTIGTVEPIEQNTENQ